MIVTSVRCFGKISDFAIVNVRGVMVDFLSLNHDDMWTRVIVFALPLHMKLATENNR